MKHCCAATKEILPDIVIGGTYRHYSGKEYQVLGFARHSETTEEMVIYQALYDCKVFGKSVIWVRPKAMFCETVIHEGKPTPRFSLHGKDSSLAS